MGAHTRMNVSVPQEIRDMIVACKEDVNWSAVASDAFRAKLSELAGRKREPSIDDAIARLRLTASDESRPAYRRGYEAGRRWGLGEASADELRHAYDFFSSERFGATDWPFAKVAEETFDEDLGVASTGLVDNPDRMAGARYAARMIRLEAVRRGEESPSDERMTAEALRIFGGAENCRDPLFLKGFMDAAASVWLDVRDRL